MTRRVIVVYICKSGTFKFLSVESARSGVGDSRIH